MTLSVRDAGARSDTGRVRSSNEDSLLVDAPLFAVADGMGGANAGEVASAIAIDTLHTHRGGETALAKAIETANGAIHTSSTTDAARKGMGTTVTALLVDGDDVVIGHVGDSRAYLYRAGRLQRLTDDHSLVEELVRRGALSPEEAERHPQRSVITRALGAEPGVDIDMLRFAAEPDDVYLLASDGLTGMVGDGEIERILAEPGDLQSRADRLVDAANQAGGEDNVTVILVALERAGAATSDRRAPLVIVPDPYEDRTPEDAGAPVPRSPGRPPTVLLAAIGAAALIVALLLVIGLQWSHFVGAQPDGRLAVYQGVPVELPFDVLLYKPVLLTDIPVAALTAPQRAAILDQRLGSRSAADTRLEDLLRTSPWLRPPTAG